MSEHGQATNPLEQDALSLALKSVPEDRREFVTALISDASYVVPRVIVQAT